MVLEYLSENSIKKYPFTDYSSVYDGSSFYLSEGVILDLQFCWKTALSYVVRLTDISNSVLAETLTLSFEADNGDSTVGFDFVIPHAEVTPFGTVYDSDSSWSIKLVPGSGMVELIGEGDFTYSFDVGTADIVTSATIQPVPKVTSIKLYNNDSIFTTLVGNELAEVDFELQAGTNMLFSKDGTRGVLEVIPGAGAGYYDVCTDLGLVITSVDAIPPDTIGNFLFQTDDCYTTAVGFDNGTDWTDNYGLTITNHCTPKCTSEQFSNFAHYLNRVKDGIDTIGEEATTLVNDFNQLVADYTASLATTKNVPYIKKSMTSFPTATEDVYYFSVIIGYFNPTEENIAVTASITPSSGNVLVDGAGRFKTAAGVTEVIDTLTGTVPCIGVGRLEFVVYGESGSVTVSGTYNGNAYSETVTF